MNEIVSLKVKIQLPYIQKSIVTKIEILRRIDEESYTSD